MERTNHAHEQRIVHALEKKDPYTLQEIHQLFHTTLFHLANRQLKNPILAEDAVSETYLKFWHPPTTKTFHSLGELKGYLLTITKNICTDYLKHQAVEKKALSHLSRHTHHEENIEMKIIRQEDYQQIINTLQHLPKKEKIILQAILEKGLSTKELAQQFNTSTQNISTRKSRAIKHIRKIL